VATGTTEVNTSTITDGTGNNRVTSVGRAGVRFGGQCHQGDGSSAPGTTNHQMARVDDCQSRGSCGGQQMVELWING
jgi:hypothetical protein